MAPFRMKRSRERMAVVPERLVTAIADLDRFLLPLLEEDEGGWRWRPREGWTREADR